jgi:hypothetical protein
MVHACRGPRALERAQKMMSERGMRNQAKQKRTQRAKTQAAAFRLNCWVVCVQAPSTRVSGGSSAAGPAPRPPSGAERRRRRTSVRPRTCVCCMAAAEGCQQEQEAVDKSAIASRLNPKRKAPRTEMRPNRLSPQ